MSGHSTESGAPTTDCATCRRTAKDCDDSHAKGWDGCCMSCDAAGRIHAHRLRMTTTELRQAATPQRPHFPCAEVAGPGEVAAAPPVGQPRVLPPGSGGVA